MLSTDNWFASSGIPTASRDGLEVFQRNRYRMDQMLLAPGGSFALYSDEWQVVGPKAIDLVEYTAAGGNVFQQMNTKNVPGLSVALIEGGAITSVRSYGEKVGGTGAVALASTRFLAASLTKPVVADVMRALASSNNYYGQSLLNLDNDILNIRAANQGGQLDTWITQVEGNPGAYTVTPGYEQFPAGVTTNKIISMDAGFPYTAHLVFVIPAANCPSYVAPEKWLRGYDCQNAVPNNYAAVWPDGQPVNTYSSPAYNVLLAIAEDVNPSNHTFPVVFKNVLFTPAGMTRTTFDLGEIAADGDISSIHTSLGVPSNGPAIRTATGGGGLYTTARDLARYLVYLDGGALGPKSGVSGATGSTGGQGYSNYSKWTMDFTNGNGIVVMSNGSGQELVDALIDRFFEIY